MKKPTFICWLILTIFTPSTLGKDTESFGVLGISKQAESYERRSAKILDLSEKIANSSKSVRQIEIEIDEKKKEICKAAEQLPSLISANQVALSNNRYSNDISCYEKAKKDPNYKNTLANILNTSDFIFSSSELMKLKSELGVYKATLTYSKHALSTEEFESSSSDDIVEDFSFGGFSISEQLGASIEATKFRLQTGDDSYWPFYIFTTKIEENSDKAIEQDFYNTNGGLFNIKTGKSNSFTLFDFFCGFKDPKKDSRGGCYWGYELGAKSQSYKSEKLNDTLVSGYFGLGIDIEFPMFKGNEIESPQGMLTATVKWVMTYNDGDKLQEVLRATRNKASIDNIDDYETYGSAKFNLHLNNVVSATYGFTFATSASELKTDPYFIVNYSPSF